jgi:hypothetical protein
VWFTRARWRRKIVEWWKVVESGGKRVERGCGGGGKVEVERAVDDFFPSARSDKNGLNALHSLKPPKP